MSEPATGTLTGVVSVPSAADVQTSAPASSAAAPGSATIFPDKLRDGEVVAMLDAMIREVIIRGLKVTTSPALVDGFLHATGHKYRGRGVGHTRAADPPTQGVQLNRRDLANLTSLSDAGVISVFAASWDEAARRELCLPIDRDLQDGVLEATFQRDLEGMMQLFRDWSAKLRMGGGVPTKTRVGRHRTPTAKNFQRGNLPPAHRSPSPWDGRR